MSAPVPQSARTAGLSFGRILGRMLPLVAGSAPFWFVLNLVGGILHSASWFIITPLTQRFFDRIQAQVEGKSDLLQTVIALAALGGAALIAQALNGFDNFSVNQFCEYCDGQLGRKLNAKAGRLEPALFDDPQRLDDIEKAEEGKKNATRLTMTALSTLTFYGVYFALTGLYLFQLNPLLAVIVPIVFLPAVLNQVLRVFVFAEAEDRAAPLRRVSEALDLAMTDRKSAKETRLLGAYAELSGRYRSALGSFAAARWDAERRTGLRELAMQAVALIGYLVVLILLVSSLLRGQIQTGAFAAVLTALAMLFSMISELVTGHIGALTRNLGTIRNYIRFLDLPERGGKAAAASSGEVCLDQVTYRYPGQEQPAIDGLTLRIREGEHLALVGANGAGKTTLVRLLSGIYLPDEGDVRIGGVSTKALPRAELFADVSAVFQQYMRYPVSLRENVGLADPERIGQDAAIQEALNRADFDSAATFNEGLDTVLSREHGGSELSGGQWQRVAIARGLFRRHARIILDEPTAAIDPLEESRIYRQFMAMSAGQTAVIVTHRLGAARIADRIAVLENGRLVAEGTHEQLMAAGGLYAEMFRSQARWYR